MKKINTLVTLLLLVLPIVTPYNFKLESTQFRGRGYIGDFGDFDNSGRLNYASYQYNQKLDKTTIYIYYDSATVTNVEVNDEDSSESREGTRFDGRNREFEVSGECDGLTASDLDSNGLLDILLIMKEKIGHVSDNKGQLYYLLAYFQNDEGKFINAWDSRTPMDVLFNKLDPIDSVELNTKKEVSTVKIEHPVFGTIVGKGGWESTPTDLYYSQSSLRKLEPTTVPAGKYELTSIHPLVADFDGDGYCDIMVQTRDYKLYFWMNYGKVFLPFYMESVPSVVFYGSVGGVIPNPHSCSFIDMNGDCRPDLVLTVESEEGPQVEIWASGIFEDKITFTRLEEVIPLPQHYGMITFSDVNSDGTNDMLVPFCYSVDEEGFCADVSAIKSANPLEVEKKKEKTSEQGEGSGRGLKVGIIYNNQMPFCPQMIRSAEEECRHPDNLCIQSPMLFSSYRDTVITIGEKYQFIYPLKTASKILFKKGQKENYVTQLARVTTGDFNNNSLMDLVLPLSTLSLNDDNKKYVVMVIKNVHKSSEFVTVELRDPNLVPTHATVADIMDRLPVDKYSMLQDEHETRRVIINTQRMLNLLVFTTTGTTLNCFYYSLHKENVDLFMKVMTKYKNIDEAKYPDTYFLSGSNNNGLTYKLTVIDINGMKNARTATLRPQTAYTPLYTPFTFIGLGKTNNYVEELYLGVSSANKSYYHMWISIIPSCTVITLPIPLHNPTQWILKLSIIPGKKLFTILLSTSIALIVLGIVILIFDFREKREDYVRAKGFRQKFIIN